MYGTIQSVEPWFRNVSLHILIGLFYQTFLFMSCMFSHFAVIYVNVCIYIYIHTIIYIRYWTDWITKQLLSKYMYIYIYIYIIYMYIYIYMVFCMAVTSQMSTFVAPGPGPSWWSVCLLHRPPSSCRWRTCPRRPAWGGKPHFRNGNGGFHQEKGEISARKSEN